MGKQSIALLPLAPRPSPLALSPFALLPFSPSPLAPRIGAIRNDGFRSGSLVKTRPGVQSLVGCTGKVKLHMQT